MSLEPDELTGTEQAVLLVLMTQLGRVPNPELAILGPALNKTDRERLQRHKLIDVFPGRPMELQLRNEGWKLCERLLHADVPGSVKGQGKVLYAVLGALDNYLARNGLSLADFFDRTDSAESGKEDDRVPVKPADNTSTDIEALVRQNYSRLASKAGDWIGLSELRAALTDVPRDELDTALLRMNQSAKVALAPEENQKSLTDADRAAAIVVGLKQNHLIAISS